MQKYLIVGCRTTPFMTFTSGNGKGVQIYKLDYDESNPTKVKFEEKTLLPCINPTACCISPNGNTIYTVQVI
jgi:hypothetical protein